MISSRGAKLIWCVLGILLACTGPLLAQRREAPLPQVTAPHPYYWREMYVPQVTSGPSSVTWSPDGRELIYSMQGSLWRQRPGATTATQLTAGDTYDFQPDWSPDGRHVLYTAYDGRALSLMLLELPAGRITTLLDDGAVNLEPRWSPDGSRVAFVSTSFNGRWHIYLARFADSVLTSIERVTEDRDSGLPRYYYSRFDHYLSPTWSPDGSELIFVSNRGRTYGTGGLWRMQARAVGGGAGAAQPREIHYEETTWKARPDWARDGKRVVYSSYHGRQWNQLWLIPADGGDAIQLTYGDFDATAPRWSPDGRQIAYISNEGGNTSLWTVNVPGGKRERIEADTRLYRGPVGRLVITTIDPTTRRPTPARVSVRGESGKFFAPDDAWRHADEAIVRDSERFEYGYWHTRGLDTLTLPAGAYKIEVWRGPEWRVATREVRVEEGRSASERIVTSSLSRLQAAGWWSGDTHVHMNYGGTYRNTPANLAFQARAEGLHVVENLVVNKEQRIPDIAYWTPSVNNFSTRDFLLAHGQEFHTGLWGHTSLLGLTEHLVLPDYAGYPGTALASLYPTNAVVFDIAHAQGAITGYVHPFDFRPDTATMRGGIPYELPVDAALGKLDFLEVMGYSDHLITSEVWYRLLNCGFRLPAAAGTDAFANFASMRGPPGLVRVFARSGHVLDHGRWLQAIKEGRTFVTNAPLLSFTIDGREPGDEIRLPVGTHRLRARATLRSAVPVEHLELVRDGIVIALFDGASDTTFNIGIDATSWYVLRAYSDAPQLPVLDLYPFASTSPIYVQVGDTQRCGADADYFIRWIDLLAERVRADRNWNTPAERDEALETLAAARSEFLRRR